MKHIKLKILLLSTILIQISCKKFIDVGPPKNSLVQQTVFQNDDQAISAVTGIYAQMAFSNSYASGGNLSVTCLSGLSSDELFGYSAGTLPFYENQLNADLLGPQLLYSGPYGSIYSANAILEGLANQNGVTPQIKMQIQGEALFTRAFAYFYLVNLYGPVPLQLTTDYKITEVSSRASVSQIYDQILLDLKAAENLLTDSYPTTERVRPNKSAAQAMLARTYLYLNDWKNAEKYASIVIAKKDTYALVDLNSVFSANSKEAIWQLMPTANSNTQDGFLFILNTTPTAVSLSKNLVQNGFEINDKRRTSWTNSITIGSSTYYYPYKYKIKFSATVTEYSMVLRLAEQYLIRAEARINNGSIDLGITDLNLLRDRARPEPTTDVPNPIPALTSTLTKEAALLAVEKERRVELFSEWGHRWFDIKRTKRAEILLGSIKSHWKPTAILYPIPQEELNRNHNITQNNGY
ncbi:RagB/SusD family nutrient uptake outer membrane protein [Pedobacter nutrimenti]|uniref:RagB/SusD family nutrient uptake outer membrane protein n=1 Tax=Pedobacter nutrimenti TaxID=1241337 RepID=UPI00292DD83A|nr:RagB/SusD family nutrient uptake outer membrane protein [Pedobacter nutrimenti]